MKLVHAVSGSESVNPPREVWVFLLVRCPAENPKYFAPLGMWPRVLQVVRDGWACPPGVIVQPGEAIVDAARRVADALGIRLPKAAALLAVDQQPAIDGEQDEEIAFVFDGGSAAEDAFADLPRDQVEVEWSAVENLERVALVHALRTRLLAVEPPVLVEGMPLPEPGRGKGDGAGE
ncbi:hypothetical protein ACMA1D_19665 [Streptomyces sp. 796.1]|uniref:hypothetical protein n=1 Tax=Streptomyces sp. 796.1 TaxID=3163029 RepID=UPI0039C96FD6